MWPVNGGFLLLLDTRYHPWCVQGSMCTVLSTLHSSWDWPLCFIFTFSSKITACTVCAPVEQLYLWFEKLFWTGFSKRRGHWGSESAKDGYIQDPLCDCLSISKKPRTLVYNNYLSLFLFVFITILCMKVNCMHLVGLIVSTSVIHILSVLVIYIDISCCC